jgi:hypothetical protein
VTKDSRESQKCFHLADRLALRPKEAAEALGICQNTLRALRSQLPVVHVGGVVLYPVDSLREWLCEQAKVEQDRVEAVSNEILASLRASGDD